MQPSIQDETPNGPQLWDAMLEVVNHPGAVIAGGCIRDWCLSIAPKDIDIFVQVESYQDFVDLVAGGINPNLLELSVITDPEYSKDAEVADCSALIGVAEGELLGWPVNIVARVAHRDGGPQALIGSFDFDVLQAYYVGREAASKAPKYTRGQRLFWNRCQGVALQRAVATMTHDKHIEQSIKRFMRFNERNPGLLSLNIPFTKEGPPWDASST